jgi:hypothetical protein
MRRAAVFEKIIALAKEYGIYVVHDLAYADICFDGWKAPSIMQVEGARDVAVEFFTMSKSYNMAGWRIGFMVGNRDLVNALARIEAITTTGRSRRSRWRRSPRSKVRNCASPILRPSIRIAAMCWSRDCTRRAGWSMFRRRRCTSGQKSRRLP